MAKEFICTATEPVVETKSGKLRGYKLGEIYHFYGVKYAEVKRWQQPLPVKPWEGIKDVLSYGYITFPGNADSPNGDLLVPHRFWPKSEDCLNLNIWTPSIDKDAKKAVMVWLHGGGFSDGSAIEMVAYDGENLSEHGDVVVVTVNHRLNVFGFLDVSAYGEEYANSQNCGMADLVAALQWVQDNIASFGGDPGNVTIFGQSGGGRKVTSLMQIPAADGLFHKAIVQSGSGSNAAPDYLTVASTAPIAEAMLKTLGTDDFNALLNLPAEELIPLYQKAVSNSMEEGPGKASNWGPLENGWYTQTPFKGQTDHAKTIPMLIGTCLGEMGTYSLTVPGRQEMSRDAKEQMVFDRFGKEQGEKLLELFYKAYPDHDALDAIILDDGSRTTTQMLLDIRANDGSAPTYNYMFAYDFPVDDGKAAWHCAEIPFAFRNIDKVAVCNEAVIGEKLQDELSTAWANFAKTGDPNNEFLPDWAPYTKEHEVTMVFDRVSEARESYDRELIKFHTGLKAVFEKPDMLM